MIAQRIAMIPVPTDTEAYSFEESCPDCKDLVDEDRGCPTCNMIYTLRALGPRAEGRLLLVILPSLVTIQATYPEAYRDIPITILHEGQMIELLGHG